MSSQKTLDFSFSFLLTLRDRWILLSKLWKDLSTDREVQIYTIEERKKRENNDDEKPTMRYTQHRICKYNLLKAHQKIYA